MRAIIGIPTLNGPERLYRALASIFNSTDQILLSQCIVLVADDGSDQKQLEANKEICSSFGVEMLYGHGRTGVAATWNRLSRHTDLNNIILINDDIEVVQDWLDVLLYSIENNKHAGMVSLACRIGSVKPAQEPTQIIDYHEARLLSANNALLASGGAIFALRREVYNAANGFDERYFCFYEEIDIGVTLTRLGYYHYISSYPNPYHLGGATTSDNNNITAQERLLESRKLFSDKWGKTPDELRAELILRLAPEKVLEWNSQLKFLKD